MSGHSKWSSIKRKKGANDEKRARMFAKLLRVVEVAAREGGPSIEGNMTLASAVQKARDFSVPMDTIERAVKRAAGEAGGARFEEITYEGYGPAGVAILVHAMTDNRNRTSQEVRHAFTRLGGSLADPGSVAWQFDRRGIVAVDKRLSPDEERLLEVVVEAGAEDLRDAEDRWEVISTPDAVQEVRGALEAAGVQVATADVAMVPQNSVPVGADKAGSVLRLIDELEELDDVQEVYSNFDIPDDVLAQVG